MMYMYLNQMYRIITIHDVQSIWHIKYLHIKYLENPFISILLYKYAFGNDFSIHLNKCLNDIIVSTIRCKLS